GVAREVWRHESPQENRNPAETIFESFYERDRRRTCVSPDPSKLLVVDDELNRGDDTLSLRIAGQGYAVEVAKNSLEALEKIRRARYDLVVLDQMTPGLSGGTTQLDLLRLLRATYSTSDLPVIVVTAADGDSATARDSIDDALRNGASDYLI